MPRRCVSAFDAYLIRYTGRVARGPVKFLRFPAQRSAGHRNFAPYAAYTAVSVLDGSVHDARGLPLGCSTKREGMRFASQHQYEPPTPSRDGGDRR
jgi:hypothetical protein